MVTSFVKWLLVIVLTGVVGWQFINKPTKGTKISSHELEKLLATDGESIILIDVREPEEFEKFRIPGAISVPLGMLDTWPILQELDKKSQIVVVCLSGVRSQFAQQMLLDMGFECVLGFAAGMNGWSGVLGQGTN